MFTGSAGRRRTNAQLRKFSRVRSDVLRFDLRVARESQNVNLSGAISGPDSAWRIRSLAK